MVLVLQEGINYLINSPGIISIFSELFEKPKLYPISVFRARLPGQGRSIYDWHQDEGTWYLSKNKLLSNKSPATLWFSVNGSDKNNSLQLIKASHKNRLYDHKYIEGQGHFSANTKNHEFDKKNVKYIETKPSEAILFHPLTLHRSAPVDKADMRPRYSIDIRYFDEQKRHAFKVDYKFKLRKLFTK